MSGVVRAGVLALVAAGLLAGSGACSSSTAETDDCSSAAIEAEKELVIVDEAITTDARALNRRPDGSAGPWSFRHLVEQMVPPSMAPGDFVRAWLSNWVTVKQVNGFNVDVPNEERVTNMNRLLLCPWLRRTPENGCSADCSTCTRYDLDMGSAPFRLMGIVNRTDLRDEIEAEPNGEARLAFALMDGAGDSPESKPLPMTIIFEYILPSSMDVRQWSEAFHRLGKHASFDEGYKAALQDVTDRFTSRGANPTARNGSALGQLRTNESVFNWIWQLREFGIADDGVLRMRGVRNTPGRELDNSDALKKWVQENQSAIRSNRFELPISMRAGSADAVPAPFVWNLAGVDQATSRAFTQNTCNGCHTDGTANETAFHLTPYRSGANKMSRHIKDPNGGPDEIARRTKHMQRALCGG